MMEPLEIGIILGTTACAIAVFLIALPHVAAWLYRIGSPRWLALIVNVTACAAALQWGANGLKALLAAIERYRDNHGIEPHQLFVGEQLLTVCLLWMAAILAIAIASNFVAAARIERAARAISSVPSRA